ncbi:MAG: Uncharacterized protein LiPW41_10 [Parcubacteria group bacterium LiPW_41]|nr:MAG: Uncharacterized protein LiPW41_10 [Parcubacteria group bacterium LiPW_41]
MKKVPQYSQFLDVTKKGWKIRACGVASLAMVLDHYKKNKKTSIDKLIDYGVSIGAHNKELGWIHSGIVNIAKHEGFKGERYDWRDIDANISFNKMNEYLKNGPIIASIHKNFNPKNSGHLVVVTSKNKSHITIHDPIARKREQIKREIPIDVFLTGWKKRIVVVRPKSKKICECKKGMIQ